MDIDTILGTTFATAVKIGKISFPARSIPQAFSSYSFPALFVSPEFSPYDLSLSGSATKVKLRGRYFAVTTRHQLFRPDSSYGYDTFCIHNAATKRFVTAERAVFPEGTSEVLEDYDCIFFEFTTQVEKGAIDANSWFDLETDWSSSHTPKPILVCACGYPGHRNEIDYEDFHYAIGPNNVWGKEDPPNIHGRLAFRPDPDITFDPSGMSGGPVFGIHLVNTEPRAFFAGVISEASRSRFHFLPFRRIRGYLEQA